MSGIVGIVNTDGAPIDRELLRRMTAFLAFRGPDGQEVWSQGHVGFGHAMLRTTDEAANERQPCSLDGQIWITADARVDGRAELVNKLKAKGRDVQSAATDAELILHAYHAWDEGCVDHLLGDFAFAIWNGRTQSLFCARDHFGVKPFFYARVANCLVFSNTLNCVRLHPAVSNELDDLAIADLLLFELYQDAGATAFADIRRLPAAHSLTWADGVIEQRCYWTLPDGDLIRYRRRADYLDQFWELLRAAVSDRLRTSRIGILMSGGLDSTAVAALARGILSRQCATFDFQAQTIVYDRLIPDEERRFAAMAAESLKIPTHFLVADDFAPFEGWERFSLPEPICEPQMNLAVASAKQLAEGRRVVLTGDDGDTILNELPTPYFRSLFRQGRWGRLLVQAEPFVVTLRKIPQVGFRSWLRRRFGKDEWIFPPWLHEALVTQLNLRDRWTTVTRPPPRHPIRPIAYTVMRSPHWSWSFENYDARASRFHLEYRHPMADIRLVNFALSLPPSPWLADKYIVRLALKGILPEAVRCRPKTPLAGDPIREAMRGKPLPSVLRQEPLPETLRYVTRAAFAGNKDFDSVGREMHYRPYSLNNWLKSNT